MASKIQDIVQTYTETKNRLAQTKETGISTSEQRVLSYKLRSCLPSLGKRIRKLKRKRKSTPEEEEEFRDLVSKLDEIGNLLVEIKRAKTFENMPPITESIQKEGKSAQSGSENMQPDTKVQDGKNSAIRKNNTCPYKMKIESLQQQICELDRHIAALDGADSISRRKLLFKKEILLSYKEKVEWMERIMGGSKMDNDLTPRQKDNAVRALEREVSELEENLDAELDMEQPDGARLRMLHGLLRKKRKKLEGLWDTKPGATAGVPEPEVGVEWKYFVVLPREGDKRKIKNY